MTTETVNGNFRAAAMAILKESVGQEPPDRMDTSAAENHIRDLVEGTMEKPTIANYFGLSAFGMLSHPDGKQLEKTAIDAVIRQYFPDFQPPELSQPIPQIPK